MLKFKLDAHTSVLDALS